MTAISRLAVGVCTRRVSRRALEQSQTTPNRGGRAVCFVHSDISRRTFIEQISLGAAAAAAVAGVGSSLAAAAEGVPVAGVGRPDLVVAQAPPGAAGAKTLDGFSKVMHNRFNQDIPAALTVQQGEAVQFLCRDALDIGTAARSLTPQGILTLDLAKVHPLTGPVSVEGAEPGDMLEVEILDVAPLVDFGYVTIGPVLGIFGSLQPDILAPFHAFTEASQLSDPTPGKVTGAIPDDQPFNTGAPFVQLFTFNKGQNTGFASFVGKDTGRKAQIPIAPFMGVYGVAPLRKGMYRTVPPNVSGGMGGNADIKQFTKGSKLYYPVYVNGAKFSVGDGHMAQGDGEVCVTAIETLMGVTCRFKVIKNTIIESPQAIVPYANPSDFAMTPEMRAKGFYQTTGVGPNLMSDAKQAVRAMIEWLVRDQGLSLHEAYAICSVAGDLKISEIVDVPNWVVSMTVPRGIFES
jgi:acetamidase/formamidase